MKTKKLILLALLFPGLLLAAPSDSKKENPAEIPAINLWVDLGLGLISEEDANTKMKRLGADFEITRKAEIGALEGNLYGVRQLSGKEFANLVAKIDQNTFALSISVIGMTEARAYLEVKVSLTSSRSYVAILSAPLSDLTDETRNKFQKLLAIKPEDETGSVGIAYGNVSVMYEYSKQGAKPREIHWAIVFTEHPAEIDQGEDEEVMRGKFADGSQFETPIVDDAVFWISPGAKARKLKTDSASVFVGAIEETRDKADDLKFGDPSALTEHLRKSLEKQGSGGQPASNPAINLLVDISLGLISEVDANAKIKPLGADFKSTVNAEIEALEGNLYGVRRLSGKEFANVFAKIDQVTPASSTSVIGMTEARAYLEVKVSLTSSRSYVAILSAPLSDLPVATRNKLRELLAIDSKGVSKEE
jgi:hypothetical protein